ncbi:MAG: hypothetical protein R6X14_09815, partial [bacterium]
MFQGDAEVVLTPNSGGKPMAAAKYAGSFNRPWTSFAFNAEGRVWYRGADSNDSLTSVSSPWPGRTGASRAVSALTCDKTGQNETLHRVHIAWNRGDRIMYRVREQGQWSGIHPISITYPYVTEPASNPALEAYGDFIYCVWRGPNLQGEFPADVWQSRRWLWHTPDRWSDPENQSQTSTQEPNFPVMATDFVTVWHEDVGSGNLDIWAKFAPDPSSRPLFQTPQPSRYPHADGYWEDEPGMVFLSNT